MIGLVEAKPEGHTLTGVEIQSSKYTLGLPDGIPHYRKPLPFAYESTGAVTQFTSSLEPDFRSREVFTFHRPEELRRLVSLDAQVRAKVSELLIDATINQALAALQIYGASADCRRYLKTFLLSNYESLRRNSAGGVQPNLNLGLVQQIAVPLAPLLEQVAIVDEVEAACSTMQVSGSSVDVGIARASRLRQSILKRAFEGKLVPQDPNDESASVLLERIRAARASLGTPARTVQRKRIRPA